MVIFSMVSDLNINFYNFPHDFDHKNNYFRDLITKASHQIKIYFPIDVYGCYPEMSLIKKSILFFKSRFFDSSMTKWLNHQQGVVKPFNANAFNIWSTFENRRPPLSDLDLTFSYDLDSYQSTNYYLPLFYLYMNIGDPTKKPWKHQIMPSDCLKKRNLSIDFF